MEQLIRGCGRMPRQRTTLYADAPPERVAASFAAAPLAEPWNPPVQDAGLKAPPRLVRPGLAAVRPAAR
jgi:FO synthase